MAIARGASVELSIQPVSAKKLGLMSFLAEADVDHGKD